MRDRKEKNKIIAVVALIAAVAITIVTVIVMSIINTPKTDFPDIDDGPGEEVKEKSLVFYNRDILTAVYNRDISATILTDIQSVVFSDEEMEFSGDNSPKEDDAEIYYDATIVLSGFSSPDPYTSIFKVKISDGRLYNVLTLTDSLEEDFSYVYTAIKREDGEKLFIMFNGDEKDKDSFSGLAEEIIK